MNNLTGHKKIYIFGAHSRAQTFGVYWKTLYPETEIIAYLVNNDEMNPNEVDGVPVIHIGDEEKMFSGDEIQLDKSLPVYIGTRGAFHDRILRHLLDLSFTEIIPVTVELDMSLRNRYIPLIFKNNGRAFRRLIDKEERISRTCLYVARTLEESRTAGHPLTLNERYIQVGCALTDKRLNEVDCFDNTGIHISNRNRQFCELTALYWIWKNAQEDIVGLEHYRRRFLLREDWVSAMKNVDVILPVPLYVHPSIARNFCDRHIAGIWNVMMNVLRRQPEVYIEAIDFFEKNGCYSPCNMLIARKPVLNDLCEWMFPIVFEVAGQVGELKDTYQNRYPGFLAERLMSFWFYFKRDQYKVVYADKSFLG